MRINLIPDNNFSDDERRDKCGVIGIASENGGVAGDLVTGLVALQHRGQESAGIATYHAGELHVVRDMGLVTEVFARQNKELPGSVGMGHVRYSTTGSSLLCNAQPIVIKSTGMELAIGFNGNILDYDEHRRELEEKGIAFEATTDTEVIGHLLAIEHRRLGGFAPAFGELMKKLDGAYSVVALTNRGELVAARDPKGFRPLCIGERRTESGGVEKIIASETSALDALAAKFVRDVLPGEVIVLGRGFEKSSVVVTSTHPAHCMFEWVYIARPDSVIEGRSVMQVRERLGAKLAQTYPELAQKIDLVVPVPDSGRSAAFGYSQASGVRMAEALQKNRYVHRTFIMPSSEKRTNAVRLKLNPVPHLLEGKRVVLVDDSIVRGTTLRQIVRMVREAGALEVHLLVSCPPIVAPCFMGVDFPTFEELIAARKPVDEIRRELGVNSLNYMTLEGLVEAIGLPKDKLCTACLTGEYPTRKQPVALKPAEAKAGKMVF